MYERVKTTEKGDKLSSLCGSRSERKTRIGLDEMKKGIVVVERKDELNFDFISSDVNNIRLHTTAPSSHPSFHFLLLLKISPIATLSV
jgi:hypothetical protein